MINPGRWRSPLAALALSLLGGFSQFAMAADLFDGTAARAFVSGEVLKPGSTVGGYPVYEGDGAWGFHTMLRTQRQRCLPRDGCEAGDALRAPRGALVDGHALFGNGPGVCGAVWIAAACALCLGQGRVNPRRKREDGGS